MNIKFLSVGKRVKLSLIAFSFVSVILGGYYLQLISKPNFNKSTNSIADNAFGWKFPVDRFPSTGSADKAVAYSDIRDPGGIPQGLPMRLKIPVIGVDTAIEDAFITSDGRMDVPEGTINVAWFALGPHPGNPGSAVIGGHFGIDNGVPKVFYNLDKLKIGDKIYVVDDKGETLAFVVRSTRSFDRDADSTDVFSSGDGLAHLNLITCEGIWNQVNDTYPTRLVIFTDAIASEGSVVVKPKLPLTATTPLKVTPTPTSTRSPTPTPNGIEKLSAYPQVFVQSVKSLYATPLDGIITSILLISIAFIAIKIIRR